MPSFKGDANVLGADALNRSYASMQTSFDELIRKTHSGESYSVCEVAWIAQCVGIAMGVVSERATALRKQEGEPSEQLSAAKARIVELEAEFAAVDELRRLAVEELDAEQSPKPWAIGADIPEKPTEQLVGYASGGRRWESERMPEGYFSDHMKRQNVSKQEDPSSADVPLYWRGSSSDLATDIAPLLTVSQLQELACELTLKWREKATGKVFT